MLGPGSFLLVSLVMADTLGHGGEGVSIGGSEDQSWDGWGLLKHPVPWPREGMLGKARRYRGSCGAVPRVGVSFISLM